VTSSLDAVVADLVRNGRTLEDAIREFEGTFIRQALEATKGNRSLAARRLGIHRNTLINKLNRLSTRKR